MNNGSTIFFQARNSTSRFAPDPSVRRSSRTLSKDGPRLLACIDDFGGINSLGPHALAVACSLGLNVTFARVIEMRQHFASPADPIAWHARHASERETLRRLVSGQKSVASDEETLADQAAQGEREPIDSVLLAGDPGEELVDWARAHDTSVIALHRRDSGTGPGLGSTAQALMEDGFSSLLLVPPKSLGDATYRRVLVPIDGSARAESVMPLARRIARTHGATLILAHVVPQADLALEANRSATRHLRSELDTCSEQNARANLETLRRRSVEDDVPVQVMTLGPADPRTELCGLLREQRIDLVVMSSHGCTGMDDVPCGSVTQYLAGHSDVPVLVVRPNIECRFGPEPESCRAQSAFRFD